MSAPVRGGAASRHRVMVRRRAPMRRADGFLESFRMCALERIWIVPSALLIGDAA